MVLQVEATGICSLLIFSDSFINHFAFDQCHYCWHKAIPRPYRGCTASRIPPRWRINACKGKKVFQHSLKSMEEISGDSKLLQESWTGSQNVLNPSSGLVSFTLFKKEEDQHCQSQIPTKYLQQANGVNLSDHKIRNRPDEGSNGGPCAHSQHCGARLAFLPQNTRTGSSTTGTLCSVLFTNDSRITLSTCDDCEKILLPVR